MSSRRVVDLAERRNGSHAGLPPLTAADVGARLPAGNDAELPLLGGLLTMGDEAVDAVVATGLLPEHFFTPSLGLLYGDLRRMRQERRAVNLASVDEECRRTGRLDDLHRFLESHDCAGLYQLAGRFVPESGNPVAQLVSFACTVGEDGTLRLVGQFAFRVARVARAGMPPARLLTALLAQVDALRARAPVHVQPVGISSFNSFSSQGGLPDDRPEPGVPAYPYWRLPEPLRRLVREGAASIGCPAGLVANPTLAHAAGVIGNRFRLRVKHGWVELANLWPVVVADPGAAKTPAAGVARRPVELLQREAFDDHAKATEKYECALEVWEAGDKKTRGEKPPPPAPLEHYFTDDVTTEGLAHILGDPQRTTPGMTSSRDELVGLVNSFNEYKGGKGSDRQTWLSMWAGRDAKIDRASRGATVLRDPVVPVTGSIQPDLLPALAADARRDGFVERFLFSYEEAPPAGWQSEEVSEASVEAVVALYRRLRAYRGEGVVDLTTEARTRFAQWCDENAERQRSVSGMLRGCYAKLPSQVARLALVLHCLTHGERAADEGVTSVTVEHAIALGDYYIAHALKVLAHLGPAAIGGAGLVGRVVKALRESSERPLPRTRLVAALGGHVKATALDAALAELLRLQVVREIPGERQGPGRPSVSYDIGGCEENELNEEIALPDTCDECGEPVEAFTADGRPKCEAHAAVAEEARG